ncbi:MAG TPA: hypothetical protein VFG78_05080 [Gemmatimonadota bacterium]|nr:hypothetical protein [Gemmatimonadota bacterium]
MNDAQVRIVADSPSQRKPFRVLVEGAVQALVRGAGQDRRPSLQTVQVIGRIAPQIADRAVHGTGGPEHDWKHVGIVERLLDHTPILLEVSTWLLRCSGGRRPSEAHLAHPERAK